MFAPMDNIPCLLKDYEIFESYTIKYLLPEREDIEKEQATKKTNKNSG